MFSLCYSKTGLAEAPLLRSEFDFSRKAAATTAPGPPADPQPVHAPRLPHPPPAFVRRGKPAASSLMHPFQWCNGESPGREGAAWREARTGRTACDPTASFSLSAKFLPRWDGREGVRCPTLFCTARNLKQLTPKKAIEV